MSQRYVILIHQTNGQKRFLGEKHRYTTTLHTEHAHHFAKRPNEKDLPQFAEVQIDEQKFEILRLNDAKCFHPKCQAAGKCMIQ